MNDSTGKRNDIIGRVRPLTDQHAREIQPFGSIAKLPIALAEDVCKASVDNLNQLIADTITLRDMYKKHHWQVAGATFYQLHLLYDKHFNEQSELVDTVAERIQSLGGISLAMAHDVAETTLIPRLPRGRQPVPVQLARLLHAHEIILLESRTMSKQQAGSPGGQIAAAAFRRSHALRLSPFSAGGSPSARVASGGGGGERGCARQVLAHARSVVRQPAAFGTPSPT